MKSRNQTPRQIVLDLRDADLTAIKFVSAVKSFFGLLTDVSAEVSGSKRAIEWIVKVKEGSVQIIAQPRVRDGDANFGINSIVAIRQGIAMIEKSDVRPPGFSDSALKHLSDLASLGKSNGKMGGDGAPRIRVGKKINPMTLHSVENVKRLLMPARTHDGSVEGRLTVISGRRGKLKVFIDDLLTDRSVECSIDPDLLKDALSPEHFNGRVIAFGDVRYRRDGEPTSIQVKSFRWLKPREDLPSYKDMRDIL